MNQTVHGELARLREENERLRAIIAFHAETERHRQDIDRLASIMRRGSLTANLARALISLASGKVHDRDMLLRFTTKPDFGEYGRNGDRNADTLVKKLRRKLPWLRIRTLYGVGYQVEAGEALTALRAFLEAHDAASGNEPPRFTEAA